MPKITDVIASQVQTATEAQSAKATQQAEAAKQKKGFTDADVFTQDGALAFNVGDKKPSREDLLKRAKRFLEILRSDGGDKRLTFGGKVTLGGVDAAASLRNYYPSLKAARELAHASPELVEAVRAFAEGVSVPKDLEPLVLAALELPVPTEEAPGPLGSVAQKAIEYYHGSYNSNDPGRLRVSDDTLRNVIFPSHSAPWNRDLNAWVRSKSVQPEVRVAMTRMWARA